MHPFVVIGNHGFHSRLLKHYFGDPYLDHPGPLFCCPELSSIASTELERALTPRVGAQCHGPWETTLSIALAFFFVNACRVVGWSPAAREANEILGFAGRRANESEL